MGLSRLDNFLKSSRGTILYVDPNSLDATDSISNKGNSLTRPFKTIQRALIESARFSYQRGLNNDRFGKTTILLYPGDHIVDNRPGFIPDGLNNYRLRGGSVTNDLPPYDLNTIFDLSVPDNELYKLNSIHGGVIIPRGTSIVGMDLRKTKIIPKYVPNPENDDIEASCVFRVTGASYFWQFSIFDADPNGVCYKDYTRNTFVPNFSHHKLRCFEYADGVNNVNIDDEFLTYSTDRTDLDMYYEKVSLVYGQSSGRAIEPDYPSSSIDIEAKIDEYRIVGSLGLNTEITDIKAGDGVLATNVITVTLAEPVVGLDVDTPFRIQGVSALGYNGQFVVSEKLSDTQITYQVQSPPSLATASSAGATLSLQTDTVSSASPYIFNVSLRSVFGMCGILADGDKATGFKSMVVAQFTGVGLQKDDNAFVKYNAVTGVYDAQVPGASPLSNDSRAIHKPSYKNFHIKAKNNALMQLVSCFAIGYAEQFVTESGGDLSITNSNSNFGARALIADGFRKEAFSQDDIGYITHIIPPKEIPLSEISLEFNSIDVGITSTNRLYLYQETNEDAPPANVIEGYRFGARENESLKVLVSFAGSVTEYSSRVVMDGSQDSSEKSYRVGQSITGINSISSNEITLSTAHELTTGESIRVISDTGQLPDGLKPNTVYYTITTGITTNTNLKVAKTLNDAISNNELTLNNNGGTLSVVSRVSDKNSGDIGHPIQYDADNSQWYINVSETASENTIYSTIVGLGTTNLGDATPRTFFTRKQDNRSSIDTIYRARYVVPKTSASGISARGPVDGFIVQESNTTIGISTAEVQTYFGSGSISNENQQRNFRFISNATWSSQTATITTELPHNLSVGSEVELVNIKSTNNASGEAGQGFNKTLTVTAVSSSKTFSASLASDPGTFSSDTTLRDTNLPHFKRKTYENTYYVYRYSEEQKYIQGEQDGIYYLTLLNASNRPTISPFTEENYSQPLKELYPQTNRDNPNSDPDSTTSHAESSLIGLVSVDDVRNSITKETLDKFVDDNKFGVGIVDILSTSGTAHTITTGIDHGLNRVTKVSIVSAGSGYGSGSGSDEQHYGVTLQPTGVTTTGINATAKVSINSSGEVTDVIIMDGGSAYEVGDVLDIDAFGTLTPTATATVQVDSIYDNVGDTIRIVGIQSEGLAAFNDVYRITNVTNGNSTGFDVESTTSVGVGTTSGIGAIVTSESYFYLTGEAINVSSLSYTASTGIAVIVSAQSHGLKVGQKVKLTGANEAQYNGDFVVTEVLDDLTAPTPVYSFAVNMGVNDTAPTATGTIYAYRLGYASNDGVITIDNENLNGRMVPTYAGITTTLSSSVSSSTTDQIFVRGISDLDINIGDYLMIDDEIVRVKTTTTGLNPVYVFRGVLGTNPTTHSINAVVRKIDINPIELRRHSISRASGHTFEYVGYGPGNYSTAFPDRQDRTINADEELISQSTKRSGGINFYTGMNDKGISYSGNKKLSTITGREEIFDTPVQTVTGEDIGILPNINVSNPLEGIFTRSVRVEGGKDGNAISEFDGPVVVTNKFTSTSDKGIEANSIFLQGDTTVSRKYTVGISTPTTASNPGDIIFNANPTSGGTVGWMYTSDNDWYRFGGISLSTEDFSLSFDRLGISTTIIGDCLLKVGSGTGLFCADTDGVGIGTTANGSNLRVSGDVRLDGRLVDSTGSGGNPGDLVTSNGTGIEFASVAQVSGWLRTATNDGIYNAALDFVGVGTTTPTVNMEVGAVGGGGTSLLVNNEARFADQLVANNVNVTGIVTAISYDLSGGTGQINAGIVTTATLNVGAGGTIITTDSTSVGVGTITPRSKLDVEGVLRTNNIISPVPAASIATNEVTLDLSESNNFTLSATSNVNFFTLNNIPSGASSFTLLITQDATGGRTVNIDDLRDNGGNSLTVNWPGGGVLPVMTPTANRSDIYSFKTFNGGTTWYGAVVGQNFA